MPETTPKKAAPKRRRSNTASDTIKTETVSNLTAAEEYAAKEPKKYQPPENMVPLNDDRYLKKDKVGRIKGVRAPGQTVERPGLGTLKVFHQNPVNYNGDIDV